MTPGIGWTVALARVPGSHGVKRCTAVHNFDFSRSWPPGPRTDDADGHPLAPSGLRDTSCLFSFLTFCRKKIMSAFDGGRLSSNTGVMFSALS